MVNIPNLNIPSQYVPGQGYVQPILSSLQVTQQEPLQIPEEVGRYASELERVLGSVEAGSKQAYGTYEDLIRQAASAYQTRGARTARTAKEAALASGFTPLEATQAGSQGLNEALRNYYALLPQLRLQQLQAQQEPLTAVMPYLGQLAELYAALAQAPGQTYQYGYTLPTETTGLGAGMSAAAPVQPETDWRQNFYQAMASLHERAQAAREAANQQAIQRRTAAIMSAFPLAAAGAGKSAITIPATTTKEEAQAAASPYGTMKSQTTVGWDQIRSILGLGGL